MLIGFLLAMAAVVIVGWSASLRKGGKSEDYYLSGRAYGPFVIGLSAAAAGNSGFIMVGCVGLGYLLGPPAFALPIGVFVGDWTYWTFFARHVHEATARETKTVPERIAQAVEKDSRSALRKVASLILLLCMSVYAAAQLHAAGITIERAFSVELHTAVVLYLLVIGSYTVFGGFKSSVMASLVHAGLMIATAVVALVGIVLAFSQAPAPLEFFRKAVEAAQGQEAFRLSLFLLQAAGYAALGLALGLGLPTLLVRVFALQDTQGIGMAKWTYIGTSHGVVSTMILLGISLHVLVPDIENPELGLFEFANAYLGPLLTGVILAGVLAAISSTVEALLIILSSAIGADLLGNAIGRLGRPAARLVQFSITAFVAASVALIALATTATVFQMVIFSVSALASAFAPVILITTFRWKTSALALGLCMCAGFASSVAWIAFGFDGALNSVLPSCLLALSVHHVAAGKRTK